MKKSDNRARFGAVGRVARRQFRRRFLLRSGIDKSPNEELKSFIQKFKINLKSVYFGEKTFCDFLARCVNLTLGFTEQVWFYFLRGNLEDTFRKVAIKLTTVNTGQIGIGIVFENTWFGFLNIRLS